MSNQPLVILIDDDPDTQSLFQDVMNYLEMQLKVAHDGESARSLLAESSPDAILLDIFLPDTDGYKLLKEIRTMHNLDDCPVVATTGYYTTDSQAAIIQRGFNGVLLKPYDPQQVIKVLKEIVQR
ncbi:MAG TPA: response regulator [Aggregatilineales bacterium]|nr:response regulator [Aggregatilineales bacterium]